MLRPVNLVLYVINYLLLGALTFSALTYSTLANAADYISHKRIGQQLQVTSNEGQVNITVLHNQAFEVLYQAQELPFPSFAKDPHLAGRYSANKLQFVEQPSQLILSTGHLTVVINKSPLRLSYYDKTRLLTTEESGFFAHKTIQGFRFKLAKGEKLMGTGERVLGMNRRGHRLPLYNRAHYAYGEESNQMNFSMPAIMSDRKYLLLFDNSANGWLDLGKSESDILQFEADGGRHSYIIFAGDTYPALIQSYVKVTGFQPLPPRWAFGNHASRFGYRSQKAVQDMVKQYQQEDIPLDSVILDLYWFGPDIQGHMGNLDWDLNTFPTPQKMISDLTNKGINTVLITEPFILTKAKKWEEALKAGVLATNVAGNKPRTYDFYFGNTGLIDVFNDKAQNWFGNIYKDLADQGVTGVWGDLGEPEVHPGDMLHTLSEHNNLVATADEVHNAYGHQWGKLVNQALTEHSPNKRQFMIMRAGFAGSQRYGLIPWTGDVSRSWDGLKAQVELSLQMGLTGMAYTHSDLGGFAGGEAFDQQLYVRWLQYGVFQPIYRPHGHDTIAPEPVFHDQKTKDIVREYIKLRYRLMPYQYTLAYQNATTGMPLMRPMFFGDENNAKLIDIKDQYLWGDSFLVKPVTDPDLTTVDVQLPQGNWVDYWRDTQYQGGQTMQFPLDLNTLPVLVKAGSIIPTVKAVNTTKDYSSKDLTLDYYFDPEVKTSNAQMYEDDGKSADSLATKRYELLDFVAQISGDKALSFSLSRNGKGYEGMPDERNVKLVIHHWHNKPSNVTFGGNVQSYSYDEHKKTLTIKVQWLHQPGEIKVINP